MPRKPKPTLDGIEHGTYTGYDGALYAELYAGWWRVDRRVQVPTGNGSGRGAKWNTEVVWSNRPLAEQAALWPAEAPA